MTLNEKQQTLLKMLPGVDHILELTKKDVSFKIIPRSVLVRCIRQVIDDFRNRILENEPDIRERSIWDSSVIEKVKETAERSMRNNLVCVVNATGVVVHTNIGRSLLAVEAIQNLIRISESYSNLEFDLDTGKRGSRYTCVEDIICEISGAESAMVVNNNAGAVLLCLETIAHGKKVIVSRGELVEIGGSFRIPDVMARSGGILTEVGTTNRTHIKDYISAIDENTALLLKVHKSNYAIVGFTADVALKELVEIGAKSGIPVMEDLGSGTFIDFSQYGMIKEPTVQDSVASGADIVTFSGDKLLGGPQAGVIVGKKVFIDKIKKNPINRALRIDKLTLAALESTMRLYRDPEKAIEAIPTLRMLTLPFGYLERKAKHLGRILENMKDPRMTIKLLDLSSRAGGGALPIQELPSKCVGVKITGMSPNSIEKYLLDNQPPIIGRIEDESFIMDPRTLKDEDIPIIENAFQTMLKSEFSELKNEQN